MSKSAATAGGELASSAQDVRKILDGAEKEIYVYNGKTYHVHPAAHIFSLVEGERYQEFVDDVKAKGLQHAVELFRGRILDGRNRMRAGIEAGVEIRFRELPSDIDPYAYACSGNQIRRDQTPSQRALATRNLDILSQYEAREHRKREAADAKAAATEASATPALGKLSGGDPPALPQRPSAAQRAGKPEAPKPKGLDPGKGQPGIQVGESRGSYIPKEGGPKVDPTTAQADKSGIAFTPPQTEPESSIKPSKTVTDAAKEAHTSRRTVHRVDEMKEKAPELEKLVKEGKVTLREANDFFDTPSAIRKAAAAQVASGEAKSLRAAVKKIEEEKGLPSTVPPTTKKQRAAAKGRKAASSGGASEATQIPDLPPAGSASGGSASAGDPAKKNAAATSAVNDPAPPYQVFSPSPLVAIVRTVLGGIDLDPASSKEAQRGVEAREWYGPKEDGVSQIWKGKVYCFPPLHQVSAFADKLSISVTTPGVESAAFLAPSDSAPEWAQKLLTSSELTIVVPRRGSQPLMMEATTPGGKPGVWRPPVGLTLYVFGVKPTAQVLAALGAWGYPLVVPPPAA